MRRIFKRFSQELYKYKPDQMVLRLNEVVDFLNSLDGRHEITSSEINSKEVIIIGNQPNGQPFGIIKWEKEGDAYVNPTVVI